MISNLPYLEELTSKEAEVIKGGWFFDSWWPQEPKPPARKPINSPPIDPSKEFILYPVKGVVA
ncbi:MAG: hypothetical protein KME40_32595 [Komarekiella atlantica HA4396-MV6]|nr:hypothetical protein [Komarekiella atlantica HA4396-MV6]